MAFYQNKKLAAVKQLSDEVSKNITRNKDYWRTFLSFYTKFYKYTFAEAMLIYAQRPEATACADFELWNNRGRRIHRGSKGIAIYNETDRNVQFGYVFDVADTYGNEQGLPHRWQFDEKYLTQINDRLTERFNIANTANGDNALQFRCLIMEYCINNVGDYLEGIDYDKEGSLLEELDFDNTRKEFLDTLIDSVGYVVCQRCGIDMGMFDEDEFSFSHIYDFNTKPILSKLGTAIHHMSYDILGEIGRTVIEIRKKEYSVVLPTAKPAPTVRPEIFPVQEEKRVNYEREQIEQRQNQLSSGFGRPIHDDRGSGSDEKQSTDTGLPQPNEVRNIGERLHETDLSKPIPSVADGRNGDGNLFGSGTASGRDDGNGAGTFTKTDAAPENGRLFDATTVRNDDTGYSGGNRTGRNRIQSKVAEGQISLLDIDNISDEETDKNITNSEVEANAPASFFMEENREEIAWQTSGKERGKTPQIKEISSPTIENPLPQQQPINYHISTENVEAEVNKGFGAKGRFKDNVAAITLLQQLENENRLATAEEQEVLAKYIGWGGMPQAFDGDKEGWHREHLELKDLLNEDEYKSARASTLNAHYTSFDVINGIYAGLEHMGFKGGNILEPAMGVGNFFATMPEAIANKSKLYGVEIDPITGRLAKQLYQKSAIQIKGFEETDYSDNFFDAAIGNVPFGQYKLTDNKYDRFNFLVHDYFIAKSIDKVRPDGVIAFVTSKGTMDKQNPAVRRYIAERAELLGAIRLPNDTFKKNANTEVTTDILFFKKREHLIEPSAESWMKTAENDEGIPLNQYFIDNPHMMLGTMAFDNRMHGNNSETTLISDGRELNVALNEAIANLPKDILQMADISADFDTKDNAEEENNTLPADPNIKNFCYAIIDDTIYQRVNSQMVKQDFKGAVAERVKGQMEIRDQVRHIINIQLDGCSDFTLSNEQEKLNKIYDAFVKKYGIINLKANRNAFSKDSDAAILISLEVLDDDKKATKSALFSKRTIQPIKKVTHADTSEEALVVSLNERGCIDLGFMHSLTDKPHEDIISELQGVIFKNPITDDPDAEDNFLTGYETADEYLSGNVREKLRIAEVCVKGNPIYQINADMLKQVQPPWLEAHEIDVQLGTTWIPHEYIKQFITETLKPPRYEHTDIKCI